MWNICKDHFYKFVGNSFLCTLPMNRWCVWDTKHTLQVIEDINGKIDDDEITLDGVAVVSLDVESMYNNMSEELGTGGCKEYLENITEKEVSTNAILTALDLCLNSNFFVSTNKSVGLAQE